MTDYEEEQSNEIEALGSIYTDEFRILETKPFHNFEVDVKSDEQDQDEPVSVVMEFTYTETYPDEPPVFEIKSYENIEEKHVDELLELMKEEAEENLGMVMVFTLVSAVQERLHDIAKRIVEERQEAEERRIKEEEEAEQKRFDGVRVTIENFLAWKAKFDAEQNEIKRKKGTLMKGPKKLTGKELFLADHSLDDSDVKFLEEEGERVEVDESLFQDLDELDLEAELDDLEL